MRFEIEIERLIDASISIHDYLFLQFVSQQNRSVLDLYIEQFDRFFTKDSLDNLISLGYLKKRDPAMGYTISNLDVTKLYEEHFGDLNYESAKRSVESVEDWIDEWYALFPKGIRNGIYPIRSGKVDCITKMKKFVKKYSEFDKDIIMKATEAYVTNSQRNNYAFMQLAKYFIDKDNMSTLAAMCEEIKDKLESGESLSNVNDYRDKFTKSLN